MFGGLFSGFPPGVATVLNTRTLFSLWASAPFVSLNHALFLTTCVSSCQCSRRAGLLSVRSSAATLSLLHLLDPANLNRSADPGTVQADVEWLAGIGGLRAPLAG